MRPQLVPIIIALCLWSGLTAPVAAQAPGWSTPVQLGAGWFPDVAADAAGQVHVVWATSIPEYDLVMYSKSTDGTNWLEPIDVQARPQVGGIEALRPFPLATKDGILHLGFRTTDVHYSHSNVMASESAAAWLKPVRLTHSGTGYFSRLAITGEGILHMLYTENAPQADCTICYRVFYTQSRDEGMSWSPAVDIHRLNTGAAKPQIVVDSHNNLHAVWEIGSGGSYGHVLDPAHVVYAASYDGGTSWTPPLEFAAPKDGARNIGLGLDGQDRLLIVWLGLPDNRIYFQASSDKGRTWTEPAAISGIWGGWTVFGALHDDYTMSTDGAGRVHLVLVGRTDEQQRALSVLHVEWDGSRWLDPEAIVTMDGPVPEWPRIAVGNGNVLNVVWYVRDAEHVWDTDNGQYAVWYSRGSSAAPAQEVVAWPSVTPLPPRKSAQSLSQDVARQSLPTPLVPASFDRQMEVVTVNPTNYETNIMLMLAKNLLPAAVIIAVTIGAVRLRRGRT